jgi:SAM-dependent methyltransferase
MCSPACVAFGSSHVSPDEIRGKRVIEVGSFDVNGSLRSWVVSFHPASYVGVDIVPGPGVDVVCDAGHLVERFGAQSFDLVISTEMLEHVRDWRRVVSNLKNLLAPSGVLLVTTRSVGFGYHAFPNDFWRFSIEDVERMFDDMAIDAVVSDPDSPGVFLKAVRPATFAERPLEAIRLYSILRSARCDDISGAEAWVLARYWRWRPRLVRMIPAVLHSPLRAIVARRRERRA